MQTGVFIGRFQPLHDGHRRCIEKVLAENDHCVVLVRDCERSDKNPFTYEERVAMIRAAFPDQRRVSVQRLADPGADLTVYIGREVGYDLIQLDATTEAISATDVRKKLYAERQLRG